MSASEWNLLRKDDGSSQMSFTHCYNLQALSPVRFDQPTSSCLTTLNQKSQKMLGTQKSRSGVTNEQPAFTESWPAPTDFESSSSSSSTASHDMESIAYKVKPGKITISSEKRNWQELSDLSKCVLSKCVLLFSE